eukprot:PhF_6_TR12538/c0_g1_i1/m.19666
MFRSNVIRLGTAHCFFCDESRIPELRKMGPRASPYPIKVNLGDGVSSVSATDFKQLCHNLIKSHTQRGEGISRILNPRTMEEVDTVYENTKYIVAGHLSKGYMRHDPKFGPRLTGYGGHSPKKTMRWI